jgi:uroporphyrin-III C-methyltransferase
VQAPEVTTTASEAPALASLASLKGQGGAEQRPRWLMWGLAGALALAALALFQAWDARQRLKSLEQELVRRQTQSQADAAEARLSARAAQDLAREWAAKAALLEARVNEASMQRSQIEELLQSVARSRDENVLADVEAAVRVASQQAAITGSAAPLVTTLQQADERLARYNQPRLERVRRALAKDLERARAQSVADVAGLSSKLDEVVRGVDELPLLGVALPTTAPLRAAKAQTLKSAASPAAASQPASASASDNEGGWKDRASAWWLQLTGAATQEARALVRVTRIDAPEAALAAPEQQFFLRENVKLRLLNARLALLSRQFEAAQGDLRETQALIERYFDRSSKRVAAAHEVLRTVAAQAKQTVAPNPEETLAALAAAAAAGR